MPMFTGKEPHDIDPEKAKGLIKAWRAAMKGEQASGSKAGGVKPHGHFFGRDALERLLAQPDCIGLRLYHALHEKGHETIVVVAADSDGRDMWTSGVAEESKPCPPFCDPDDR